MKKQLLFIGLFITTLLSFSGNVYVIPQYGSNGQVGLTVGRYSLEHFNFYSTLMFNPQFFKEFSYDYEVNNETGDPEEMYHSTQYSYYSKEDDHYIVSEENRFNRTGTDYQDGKWKLSLGMNYSFNDRFRINFGYGFQRNLYFEEILREREFEYSNTNWSSGTTKVILDQEVNLFKNNLRSKSLSYLDIGFSFKLYKRLNASYMFNFIEGTNSNSHNVGLGFRI